MPVVRLIKGTEADGEVFVSLEQTPIVLAKVREALPRLQTKLHQKWPVQSVEIYNRLPRRKNPYDPSELVTLACIGLLIRFTWSAVDGAGKKFGEGVGEELSEYVRRWIRRIGKPRRRSGKKAS